MRLNTLTRYLVYQLYHAATLVGEVEHRREPVDVHEFRVSVRRIRSLTKLYLEASAPFPGELKSAVKATNTVRELDVLIASIKPKKFPRTTARLRHMRLEYAATLFTPEFREETFRSLHRYIDALCDADPDIPHTHLIERAENLYAACLEEYRTIDETTSQKKLHRLRVRFKNARYALEFLSSAGIHDEQEKTAECKRAQNRLGAVQDLYNQIVWLKKVYEASPSSETKKLLKERKHKLKTLKAASRLARYRFELGSRSSG